MQGEGERERENLEAAFGRRVSQDSSSESWPFSTEERRNHSQPGKVGQRVRARARKKSLLGSGARSIYRDPSIPRILIEPGVVVIVPRIFASTKIGGLAPASSRRADDADKDTLP